MDEFLERGVLFDGLIRVDAVLLVECFQCVLDLLLGMIGIVEKLLVDGVLVDPRPVDRVIEADVRFLVRFE